MFVAGNRFYYCLDLDCAVWNSSMKWRWSLESFDISEISVPYTNKGYFVSIEIDLSHRGKLIRDFRYEVDVYFSRVMSICVHAYFKYLSEQILMHVSVKFSVPTVGLYEPRWLRKKCSWRTAIPLKLS